MRDIITNYLGYLQVERGLSPNTLESYKRDLRLLKDYGDSLGKDLQTLNKDDLVGWLKSQHVNGISPNTITRRISTAKGFYNYLLRDGVIVRSPSINLTNPRNEKRIPKPLNIEEVEIFLNAPDLNTYPGIRDRALIELFYATGLRVSEMVDLRVDDISLERAVLTCRGKGAKQRLIPLGRSALACLNRYLEIRDGILNGTSSEALFVLNQKRKMTRQVVWLILKRYAEQAGLDKINPHRLRHTFASHLIQSGADSRSVQILLGHSDLSTTQIYTHMSTQHLSESIKQFHPRGKSNIIGK